MSGPTFQESELEKEYIERGLGISRTCLRLHFPQRSFRSRIGKALAEAGCSPRDIASVLGQKSEAAARIYADEEDRRKRASTALKKLERRRPKNIAATENV
jgi:hypothetical protein